MKKNIISQALFTFICMFIVTGNVLAVGYTGNISALESVSGTGEGFEGNSSTLNAKGNLSSTGLVGIRISFYNSSGGQISSTDYVMDKYAGSSYSTISELQEKFVGLNVNIASLIKNNNLSKSDLFFEALNSVEKIQQLFENLLGDLEKYYNGEAYDLFLVWEPLGRVVYDGKSYIGTVHELSNFVDSISGEWTFCSGSTCNTVKNGYNAIGRSLVLDVGCSVVLEDSDDFGNDVSKKFNTFTSRTYFNGAFDANTAGVVNDNCMKKGTGTSNEYKARDNLKPYALSYQSALGVGILWYDLGIKEDDTPQEPDSSQIPCSTYYNVTSCSSSSIYYYDTNDWENCVFNEGSYDISVHKYSSPSASLTYYDSSLSSDYCDVYCIENVNANFDSNNPTVLAGSNFTWGWSTITTSRTCKTKSIDLAGFNSDLDNANAEVVQQLAQQKLYELNEGKSWIEGEEENVKKTCYTLYDHTTGQHLENTCIGISDWTKTKDECEAIYQNVIDGHSIQKCNYEFERYSCTNYTYQGAVTSTSVTIAGITKTATYNNFSVCTNRLPSNNPVPTGNASQAIKKVEKIISEMKKCTDFDDNNVLTDESAVSITYISEGGIYNYSGDLDKSTNVSHFSTSCDTKEITALLQCDSTSCSKFKTTIYYCDTHEETRTIKNEFSLSSGIYQYVLKNPNNLTLKSIHSWELGGYDSGTLNWIDIGYSNFPVPYDFGTTGYTGELKITYLNLGHKNSANSETSVDTILRSSDVDPNNLYGEWICKYEVEADLINDNDEISDINIIYRVIDLFSPFPDTDASNRKTGSNWCYASDCKWNNDTVTQYILNNRGVTSKDLYDLEPMYTFIMTPSDIIQIRRYNNENSYTSYNGSYSGKNYNFKCITGTGKGCRSEYLTELMDIMDSYDNPGTCTSDRGLPTSIDAFESCRY